MLLQIVPACETSKGTWDIYMQVLRGSCAFSTSWGKRKTGGMGDAEICLCTMRAPGDTKRAMIISATKEDESGVAGRGGGG